MTVGSGTIRVLIVDDIPETRENVRKLLAFESDIEVVGVAGTGLDAISAAKEFQPDIALMDINMPGLDGISAVEAISQEAPGVQVIMMSVQSEQDYLRRSMLAGARDFLTKPFTGDELVSTIRRVNRMGQRTAAAPQPVAQIAGPTGKRGAAAAPIAPAPEGSVIVVFGPKGGVGASTLTVNLAVALQQRAETKVALIDSSLQFSSIDVLLNLHANRSIADISQTINDLDAELISTVVTPHPSGMKALLAPTRPELAELVLPDHMERIVGEMRRSFDYIVIDTPSTLSDLVLTTLDLADRVILLTLADVPSIKNTRTFFQVTEALGYTSSKIMLVINQFDPRNPITVKMIEDNLKHKVAFQIPLDVETINNSIRKGLPFVTEAKNKPIVNAVNQLTERLIAELHPPEEVSAEGGGDDASRKRGSRFFRQ